MRYLRWKLRYLWYVQFLLPALFVLMLACNRVALYGNNMLSIVALSAKKWYCFKKGSWLIWATYNSLPNISENKTENRSKNTRPRKILRGCIFSILFCIVFSDISENRKHAATWNFTRQWVYVFVKFLFYLFIYFLFI